MGGAMTGRATRRVGHPVLFGASVDALCILRGLLGVATAAIDFPRLVRVGQLHDGGMAVSAPQASVDTFFEARKIHFVAPSAFLPPGRRRGGYRRRQN